MKNASTSNDNDPDDPLPFITLGALTQNVVAYLTSNHAQQGEHQENKNAAGNSREPKEDEKQSGERGRYIEQRTREIREFENRAAGLSPHRRSGRGRR